MASNAELISRWSTVTEPLDALCELVEHARDFGYDPYYAELFDAIWAMADRVVKDNKGNKIWYCGQYRTQAEIDEYNQQERIASTRHRHKYSATRKG